MTRYFGCHVSVAGGLTNAIVNGKALGVNAIQLHPTPPQRWNFKPFEPGVERQFLKEKADSGIEKIFFHGIYLINLAAGEKSKLSQATLSLCHYLALMERIAGDGVIFHVGSNKDQESEEAGFQQAADAINNVLAKTPGTARLLLEVAAGSGKIIGDRMEELRAIYDLVEDKKRVGFALDTQHLWASGYDLRNDLEGFVQQADAILGLDNIAAVHVNDSKTDLGSHVDRHENLGEGKIGAEALTLFLNHQRLKQIPAILETPGLKDINSAADEVNKLRRMVGA